MPSKLYQILGSETNKPVIDKGTLALTNSQPPVTTGLNVAYSGPRLPIDRETRLLAALAYGEASKANLPREMGGIANVLVRQKTARGFHSLREFIKKTPTFAYAAGDGNPRYKDLMAATETDINFKYQEMADAVAVARNAFSSSGIDYSNGAYFWDGADIKSNYTDHPKVIAGIYFTEPAHNIYGIKATTVPGEVWWKDPKGHKTKIRGKWNYKYESTAAWGGTIFWRYNKDFITASGNTEYD